MLKNENNYYPGLSFDELIDRGPYTEYYPYRGECYGNNYWTCNSPDGSGVTIQQYAEQHYISYEAARRQVKRYRHLLIPHIQKIYNTQFLDDQAVELLESHLRPRTQPEDTQQVRNQIKKLAEDIQENRINIDTVQNLNQEIGSLKSDKKHLQTTMENLKEDLTKSEEAYKKLTEEYNGLKIEFTASQKEIEKQQEYIQTLKKTITDLEEKLEMIKNFQKILERQVNYYRDILDGKEPRDPFKDLDFTL